MPDMKFEKPDEQAEAKAPSKPADTGKKEFRKRKIVIGVGENGETENAKVPDPNHPQGGHWLILPRNKEIEVDERAIAILERCLVIKTEGVVGQPDYKEIPQKRFPVHYRD